MPVLLEDGDIDNDDGDMEMLEGGDNGGGNIDQLGEA